MYRSAGADRVDEIRDVQDGHVVVGMRIEAVSGLRGEGLLHDFALDVVHGVAVAVHDHAARGAEDGGAALATVRSQAVAALALPDDGFAPRELEAGFLGVGELPVIVEVIAAADTQEACLDRKSTRLNSSHPSISYAVFCLKNNTPPR